MKGLIQQVIIKWVGFFASSLFAFCFFTLHEAALGPYLMLNRWWHCALGLPQL
jgi:hypothetical protein